MQLLRIFRLNGINRLEVFSGEAGQVLMSAYHENECFDIYLNSDSTFYYELETDDETYELGPYNYDKLNHIVRKIVRRWKSSSEFCMPMTIAMNKSVSKVQLSKIPKMAEESRYLIPTVHWGAPIQYVDTLRSSTPQFQTTLQSSGEEAFKKYRMVAN